MTAEEEKVAAEKAATDKAAADKAAADKATADKAAAEKAATFDAWLQKQPADVQALYAEQTKGLTSALQSEREKRKELEKGAKRLADLEKAESERTAAQLSETDKLKKQLEESNRKIAEMEQQQRTNAIKHATETAAAKAGFINPARVYALIDSGTLDTAEDGSIKGLDEALQALAKSDPYLLQPKGTLPRRTTGVPGEGVTGETDEQKRKRIFG